MHALLFVVAITASPSELPKIKETLRSDPNVRKLADRALKLQPLSVTAHRPPVPGLDPHEYYSEGPYWWPDPKNPEAPFIRRDGERNPERFERNRRDLGDMASAVLALGMAAAAFDDPRYGQHASKLLQAWFLDPETRMNPDLEHGQAIRGRNDGRGTGIIDTISLIHAVQGIWLLEQSGAMDDDMARGLRDWYASYLKWMLTSKKGKDEERAENNHGTWWTAQAAAYAAYVGDKPVLQRMYARYRSRLVPVQIEPDGSCPREEQRTRSLSYTRMNLDGFAVLARIAEVNGEDLWTFEAPGGRSLSKAIRYAAPFMVDATSWKKQQITPVEKDRPAFLVLAALGLDDKELTETFRRLPIADSPWAVWISALAG